MKIRICRPYATLLYGYFKKCVFLLSLFLAIAVQAQTVKVEKDGFKWIPYSEYGRVGAQSQEGKILIPAKYSECFYEGGRFSVKDNMGNYGVFDTNGKAIIPCDRFVKIFTAEGVAKSPYLVYWNKGWGMLSHTGKEIIPARYMEITPYPTSKGMYYVVKDYNFHAGIADKDGNWIIKTNRYNDLAVTELQGELYFSYAIFGDNRCSGVCNALGQEMNRTQYTCVIPQYSEKGELYYKINYGCAYGFMDLAGKVIKAPSSLSYYPVQVSGKSMYESTLKSGSKFLINKF